jgi:hypothetical protein
MIFESRKRREHFGGDGMVECRAIIAFERVGLFPTSKKAAGEKPAPELRSTAALRLITNGDDAATIVVAATRP